MKKLVIASVVALSASISFGSFAQAATVKIVDHHHHKHCYTRKVVHHYHGKRVVKAERVCR